MNIAKNMELVFIAATLLAGASSMAFAKTVPLSTTTLAPAAKMQVVVVSAKRLSAAEKAAIPG